MFWGLPLSSLSLLPPPAPLLSAQGLLLLFLHYLSRVSSLETLPLPEFMLSSIFCFIKQVVFLIEKSHIHMV